MSFATRFLGNPDPIGFTVPMLERFVSQGIEENLNLDYKDFRAIDRPDKLAETISAFGNSDGGLLVLGVEESRERDDKGNVVKIRPGKVTWGSKSSTKEALESMLVSRIHPWVDGIRIHPIRDGDKGVVFLLDVPQSSRPPHQAHDGKYYLRYNFQNLPMEHYQVEALFGKRNRPEIEVSFGISNVLVGDFGFRFRIAVIAENKGRVSAKYPKIVVTAQGAVFRSIEAMADITRYAGVLRGGPTAQYGSANDIIYPDVASHIGYLEIESKGPVTLVASAVADEMPMRHWTLEIARELLPAAIAKYGSDNPDLLTLPKPTPKLP